MFRRFRHKIFTKVTFFSVGFIFTFAYFTGIPHTRIESSPTESHWSNEDEEWELSKENIPDLNTVMNKQKLNPKGVNSTCAKFPTLYDIHFSNLYYQVQDTEGRESYFLYNAYLDTRSNTSLKSHRPYDNFYVRILAMSDTPALTKRNASLQFCQFWFEKRRLPIISTVTEIKMIWHHQWGTSGHYFPYLVMCRLPRGMKQLPTSISLAPHQCSNATNNLIINHRDRFQNSTYRPKPDGIAVCVKALDFPNSEMENKLVEWIEALRLLGAKKIFFYEYFINSEIRDILEYYENEGIIGVTKTALPGNLPNHPQLRHLYIQGVKLDKRLTELLPYNDCFYRNMYDYEYIAVLDTDEIIIPASNISWPSLIQTIKYDEIGPLVNKKKEPSSFCFENIYFLDGMMAGYESKSAHIPQKFHMLRHIYRARNSTGRRFMKCIHSTQQIVAVHNHFALFCKDGNQCGRHFVSQSLAQMNHYRSTCVKEIKNCSSYIQESVEDNKIWRLEKDIRRNVEYALRHIS